MLLLQLQQALLLTLKKFPDIFGGFPDARVMHKTEKKMNIDSV